VTRTPLRRSAAALAAGLSFGVPRTFGLHQIEQTGDVWIFAGFPAYGNRPFENIGIAPARHC
jgi:hypothetical protein